MIFKEAKEVLNKNGYYLIDEGGADLTGIIHNIGILEDEYLDKREDIIAEINKFKYKQENILKELVYKTLNPFLKIKI